MNPDVAELGQQLSRWPTVTRGVSLSGARQTIGLVIPTAPGTRVGATSRSALLDRHFHTCLVVHFEPFSHVQLALGLDISTCGLAGYSAAAFWGGWPFFQAPFPFLAFDHLKRPRRTRRTRRHPSALMLRRALCILLNGGPRKDKKSKKTKAPAVLCGLNLYRGSHVSLFRVHAPVLSHAKPGKAKIQLPPRTLKH